MSQADRACPDPVLAAPAAGLGVRGRELGAVDRVPARGSRPRQRGGDGVHAGHVLGRADRHGVASDRAQQGARSPRGEEAAPVERGGLAHVSGRPSVDLVEQRLGVGELEVLAQVGGGLVPRTAVESHLEREQARALGDGRRLRSRAPARRARLRPARASPASSSAADAASPAERSASISSFRAATASATPAASSSTRPLSSSARAATRCTASRDSRASRSAASTSAFTCSAADRSATWRRLVACYLTRNAPRMNGWIRQKYV